MAKIALEGIKLYAYHGFYEEENIIGNPYLIDVYIEADLTKASLKDDLGGTVNYETIYQICKLEMKEPSKMLEHVGQRIYDRLDEQFPDVDSILVRISKMNPPLEGPVARAYIEIDAPLDEEKILEILKKEEEEAEKAKESDTE